MRRLRLGQGIHRDYVDPVGQLPAECRWAPPQPGGVMAKWPAAGFVDTEIIPEIERISGKVYRTWDAARRRMPSSRASKDASGTSASDTLFSTLTEARNAISSWKEDDNRHRPHSALGNITPAGFALRSTLEKQAARGQTSNSGLSLRSEEKRVSGQMISDTYALSCGNTMPLSS